MKQVRSEKAEVKSAPKLRFPEFRTSGTWKGMRLADALEFQPGFPFPSKGFNEGGSGLRLIRNRDLRSNDKPVYYSDVYNVDFVVNDGDILVGMDGDFTPCVWSGGQALLNQRVGRVSPKGENHTQFLLYFLTAQLKAIEDSTARTTVKHLSHSELEKVYAALPSNGEQQKIADCLTSLDEVIAAQGRKVEALKVHKRGLTQQLFPREGETRPRLRFPQFRNDRDWQRMTFGQAATFYNGRAYKQEELLENGKYPVLRVGNFFTSTRWYYSDLELDATKYCENGDLLYAWSASFGPRIWRGEKSIYHYHIWKVIEELGVDKAFLFISLENETENMKARTTNGLGIMHITKGAIEKWESIFPSHAEQKKVADCLTTLGETITANMEKLNALNVHKVGLMQQLFPPTDAVQS